MEPRDKYTEQEAIKITDEMNEVVDLEGNLGDAYFESRISAGNEDIAIVLPTIVLYSTAESPSTTSKGREIPMKEDVRKRIRRLRRLLKKVSKSGVLDTTNNEKPIN